MQSPVLVPLSDPCAGTISQATNNHLWAKLQAPANTSLNVLLYGMELQFVSFDTPQPNTARQPSCYRRHHLQPLSFASKLNPVGLKLSQVHRLTWEITIHSLSGFFLLMCAFHHAESCISHESATFASKQCHRCATLPVLYLPLHTHTDQNLHKILHGGQEMAGNIGTLEFCIGNSLVLWGIWESCSLRLRWCKVGVISWQLMLSLNCAMCYEEETQPIIVSPCAVLYFVHRGWWPAWWMLNIFTVSSLAKSCGVLWLLFNLEWCLLISFLPGIVQPCLPIHILFLLDPYPSASFQVVSHSLHWSWISS